MRSFGGKARVGKHLIAYLEHVRKPSQPWIEPFCGGLWMTHRATGERFASDGNKALITLYQEAQKGWVPPEEVTEELYHAYKAKKDPTDPLTAFIGFGCSFAGKWFGGYARDSKGFNYAASAKRSLLKKMTCCNDVMFFHADYREALLQAKECSLGYLDPPYANTTGYDATGSFDVGQFWSVVRKVSEEHDVYVSEYSAPPDFKVVYGIETKTDIRDKTGQKVARIERLYKYEL